MASNENLQSAEFLLDLGYRIQMANYKSTQSVMSSVVHETNNILSILYGTMEALEDGLSEPVINPKELKDDLAVLRRSLLRLQDFMGDMRKVYRPMGAGKIESNLDQVLTNVLGIYSFKLNRARVTLEKSDIPSVLLKVPTADLVLLLIIFLENVVDAADSLEKGSMDLRINYGQQFGVPYLEFESIGIGMDPAVQAKLGQPFVSSRPKETHLGLGVFVAQNLLKKSGGSLSWESDSKRVSFKLTLPEKF